MNIIQPDNKRRSKNVPREVNDFQLLRNACSALWSCSKCPKNIQAIRAAGAVPILSTLLVDGKDDVVLPVMGIIQECASEVRKSIYLLALFVSLQYSVVHLSDSLTCDSSIGSSSEQKNEECGLCAACVTHFLGRGEALSSVEIC